MEESLVELVVVDMVDEELLVAFVIVDVTVVMAIEAVLFSVWVTIMTPLDVLTESVVMVVVALVAFDAVIVTTMTELSLEETAVPVAVDIVVVEFEVLFVPWRRCR